MIWIRSEDEQLSQGIAQKGSIDGRDLTSFVDERLAPQISAHIYKIKHKIDRKIERKPVPMNPTVHVTDNLIKLAQIQNWDSQEYKDMISSILAVIKDQERFRYIYNLALNESKMSDSFVLAFLAEHYENMSIVDAARALIFPFK